jgi:hypothetical protein
MMTYDLVARHVLKVLSQDLSIEEEDVWRDYEEVTDKYKYRPSSLLLALIERRYPNKRVLIRLAHNVSPQTITQIRSNLPT